MGVLTMNGYDPSDPFHRGATRTYFHRMRHRTLSHPKMGKEDFRMAPGPAPRVRAVVPKNRNRGDPFLQLADLEAGLSTLKDPYLPFADLEAGLSTLEEQEEAATVEQAATLEQLGSNGSTIATRD